MRFQSQTPSKWAPKRLLRWVFQGMRWNCGIMMLTSLLCLVFTKKSSQGTILMTSLDLKNTSQMLSTRSQKTLPSNKTCCIRNRQGSLCPCRSRNAKRNWNSQSQRHISLITNKQRVDFLAALDSNLREMDTSKSHLLSVKNKLLTTTKTMFLPMRSWSTPKSTTQFQRNQRRSKTFRQLLTRRWNHTKALREGSQTFTSPNIKIRTLLNR